MTQHKLEAYTSGSATGSGLRLVPRHARAAETYLRVKG